MKNFKLLLVIAIGMLMFQACNNETEGTSDADLVGVWEIDNLDFDVLINNESLSEFFGVGGSQIEALFTAQFEAEYENSTFEFKSDNSYEVIQPGSATETGTWAISADGNQLIFDEGSSDETTFNISSVSSTSLILNIEESENSEDLDGDGTDDEVKVVIDLYLAK
jgi:hypothetical protein